MKGLRRKPKRPDSDWHNRAVDAEQVAAKWLPIMQKRLDARRHRQLEADAAAHAAQMEEGASHD